MNGTDFYTNTYNPDVLLCLANLSNDEVFTPPDVVNKMLDTLLPEIFRDKSTTFLDPACKSGVFLREIAKRLLIGLEDEFPDLQNRIDHIFKRQLFGIAITEMTSLLSRRSVYCSKYPNGKYSITTFGDAEGNIRYKKIQHRWIGTKCALCGASKAEYDRNESLETHAYEFIHTSKPEELFKMKFDVIIGNPPYQLDTGGSGRQAKPIYNLFIDQAKKLNPRYLAMIIPSRWFAGGMGLDDFRKSMIEDQRIRVLVDYANAKDCFPQNSISGGVCYFLWDRDHRGVCSITSVKYGEQNTMLRSLNEFPVLVRYNDAVGILRKISGYHEDPLSSIVSSLTPFGLPTNYRGTDQRQRPDDLTLYASNGVSYVRNEEVTKGRQYVNKYKVMVSKTGAEHAGEPGRDGKSRVLTSSMRVLEHGEVCTHSYFLIGAFEDKMQAEHVLEYLKTKFVRFLILQAMTSINLSKGVFQFVPQQDFTRTWTDEALVKKYGLTDDEIAFIDSMVRPMDLGGEEHE